MNKEQWIITVADAKTGGRREMPADSLWGEWRDGLGANEFVLAVRYVLPKPQQEVQADATK